VLRRHRLVRVAWLAGRVSLACAASSVLLACGGSSSGGSTSGDASVTDGASGEGGHGGGEGGVEAGVCLTSVEHRPTATACPSHADAGVIEAGPSTCGQPLTPQDACLGDPDCAGAHGANGVCVCQDPHGDGCGTPLVTGNACVPSSCHVDSDCTACGTCRVEQSCGVVTGYYCGSPADECASNADCGGGFCTFQGDHFACRNDIGCPG
jgi:hypothetical protein